MTIRAVLLASMICRCSRPTAAKDVSANGTPRDQRVGFFGGYHAHTFKNPGLQLGAEGYLATTRNFEALAAGSFQLYREAGVENGYSLHARIGQRLTGRFGLSFETQVGVGVQLTDYLVTAFVYPDNELVVENDHALRTAFTPHVMIGMGVDLRRTLRWPVRFYARPGISWLYPDLNLAFQTNAVVEVGLVFIRKPLTDHPHHADHLVV